MDGLIDKRRARRNKKMEHAARLLTRDRGASVAELAEALACSRRTVYLILGALLVERRLVKVLRGSVARFRIDVE